MPSSNAPSPDSPELPTDAERQAFRNDLLQWYRRVRREMPWRATDDPYRIWVSEVMLQQTRVDQAEPFYKRFIEAFPDVEALAGAEQDEVLRLWEGLGYYSRARNLHKAARQVVNEHAGRVPDKQETIRELPGVGPYTAAAVLSIAHAKPHAVLDGNVQRVLTRVYAVDAVVSRAGTRRRLQSLADELLDANQPGTFNQALMELGATVCTPSQPRCGDCPLQTVCRAREAGTQATYPVKKERTPVPHRDIAVGLVTNEHEELLIQRRPEDGLLGGLWEFPGGKREDEEAPDQTCQRELQEETGIEVQVDMLFHRLNHAYSHFKITLYAYQCRLLGGTPRGREGQPIRWVAVSDLDDYAFPRANRRLIEKLQTRQRRPTLFD